MHFTSICALALAAGGFTSASPIQKRYTVDDLKNLCPDGCPDDQVCKWTGMSFSCASPDYVPFKARDTPLTAGGFTSASPIQKRDLADGLKNLCPDGCPDDQVCKWNGMSFSCASLDYVPIKARDTPDLADRDQLCPEGCPDGQTCQYVSAGPASAGFRCADVGILNQPVEARDDAASAAAEKRTPEGYEPCPEGCSDGTTCQYLILGPDSYGYRCAEPGVITALG